jgi:alkylation response protein AidB-like acyl-CoA dehydrogenase
VWRQRIAGLAIQAKVMKAFGLRVLSDQIHGRFNPHTSAAMKCIATRLTQQFSEAGVEMEGYYGLLLDEGRAGLEGQGAWANRFLYDRSMTIAGGTSEIQRNIVAERILGLPRR